MTPLHEAFSIKYEPQVKISVRIKNLFDTESFGFRCRRVQYLNSSLFRLIIQLYSGQYFIPRLDILFIFNPSAFICFKSYFKLLFTLLKWTTLPSLPYKVVKNSKDLIENAFFMFFFKNVYLHLTHSDAKTRQTIRGSTYSHQTNGVHTLVVKVISHHVYTVSFFGPAFGSFGVRCSISTPSSVDVVELLDSAELVKENDAAEASRNFLYLRVTFSTQWDVTLLIVREWKSLSLAAAERWLIVARLNDPGLR